MQETARDTDTPLFMSVDYAYKRSDLVIFSFLPCFEQEARSFVSNLAAHMIHKYKENSAIYEYFTPEACERANEVEWDEITQQLVTKDDKYICNLDSIDDDIMNFDAVPDGPVVTSVPPSRVENIFTGATDDSVGTFRHMNVRLHRANTTGIPVNTSDNATLQSRITANGQHMNSAGSP
jgi:hypothetical protein